MDPNLKLLPGQGEPLENLGRYHHLVGRLNYLSITRPNITCAVSVVSQFQKTPYESHWDVGLRILQYIKNAPGCGGGNVISCRSRNAKSSFEVECRTMADTSCLITWLKKLLNW